MNTPLFRAGKARAGATGREDLLMVAVARLFLDNFKNIQVSWVKEGIKMAQLGLIAGANDLGGTMFEESISKGAGATNTDYLDPAEMQRVAEDLGQDAPAPDNALRTALKPGETDTAAGEIPMRRKDREITDRAEIEAILDEAMVCRIGLADGGDPYVVPLCFGYEDGSVYIHSARRKRRRPFGSVLTMTFDPIPGGIDGKKIAMIRKNPRCCFEVDMLRPGYQGRHAVLVGDAVPERDRVRQGRHP